MKTIEPRVFIAKMFAALTINKLVKTRNFQQIFRYAKFGPKSREEREAEAEAERIKMIRNSITSMLQRRQFLSVPEWKSLHLELQKLSPNFKNPSYLNRKIFNVLQNLRPPNDSMKNAQTLIEAFGIKYDLSLKRILIQLYAKKASEQKLNDKEEQELIELLVTKYFHSIRKIINDLISH